MNTFDFTTEEIKYSTELHKKYGKTFYLGTRLFPKDIRDAICVLYAFVRIPDEFVDNPEIGSTEKQITDKILSWKISWQNAYETGGSKELIFTAAIKLFKKYSIPVKYSYDFLDAMIQDVSKSRYADFEDLDKYMWGSASVVGLMCSYICGYTGGESTLDRAHLLGDAFQITNFLRDIDEDLDVRNRIYMPQDELKKFLITEEDISRYHTTQVIDQKWIDFMKFQIERNRKIYTEAMKGIQYLNLWRVRVGVCIAAVAYRDILREIEKKQYNVFRGRVYVSKKRKIFQIVKIILLAIYNPKIK